jgi:hypothetical protein
MSAARASGRTVPARVIKQALRNGARPLMSGTAVDQGAGLPDVTHSWQWLAVPHDVAELAVDVGSVKGTVVNDARAETGGPNRTPRSEIRPAVSANRKKEPVLLLDLSTSMNWGAADEYGPEWPDAGSRRAIVIEALQVWSGSWSERTARQPPSRPTAVTSSGG